MPKVKINDVDIHYRVSGKGDQVLMILNGIMMSVASWMEMVPTYTRAGYKVINVDFRDQGESGSSPGGYSNEQHVEDLKGLLTHLEIKSCTVLGISYGGQVAMMLALAYPEMVRGLILANTMSRFTPYLRAIGAAWDEGAKLQDGETFFKLAMPLIYSDVFYERKEQWLQDRAREFGKAATAQWFQRYLRLSSSLEGYDISGKIHSIEVPTLVIASDKDVVTPYEELLMIHRKIKNSLFVMLPEAGHASCYEKMREFNVQVLGFLVMNQGMDG
ncbi:alpha/beta hydrolase fold [Alkaliphilus metalliredigens QYMF]|uniref:Alpha/beta hydrolase fold n=1 Tax=Alkaliphilus metalliredigens (strain QYMF) TaxID=293826 RepID=A6TK32_ALKMQ|nr:alpha/beta hydrolase [Alkaliphilus metalliredigens]ABR46550.1 alpha/beta hydrolase fold [Alkaliphilus metalliredigens QYMF]